MPPPNLPSDGHDPPAGDSAHPDATDIQLVRRVQSGDRDAYGELVRRHMHRAFSIAHGILRHREDAEDVVQESFLRALERIDQIGEGRPFHPWLFRIIANGAISYHRSRVVRRAVPLKDEILPASDASQDCAAERSELRDRLLRALDTLPERQRTIVLLADVEEFSSPEIGEILEMPPGTVRYQLHLGRRALRVVLSAVKGEMG